jgi:hypothetical protein
LDTETQGKQPCEVRGRNWSDIATTQRMPRIARNHQKLQWEHGTTDNLIADFKKK